MIPRCAGLVSLALFLTLSPGPAPAFASPLAAQSDSTRTLAEEDAFAIKGVGNVRISPGGEWVAYSVRTTNLEKDRSRTRLWMVATRGGEPIPLTVPHESASSPAWSPDGKYLAFLASRGEDAETQVWVLDRRGGEARQLTEVEQGVQGYVWSPDGSRLVLTVREADTTRTSGEGEGGLPKEPWVMDRVQFKRDGRGYLTDRRPTQLHVFDLETETLTQITSGPWAATDPAWNPDGSRIAFVSNRTEDLDVNSNSDIWVVSADNTDQGGTLVRITDYEGGDSGPTWSPDGRWIAYLTGTHTMEFANHGVRHLAVAAADGSGERRVLTRELDRNVGSPEFTPDGEAVMLSVQESGEAHVARVDVETGAISRPVNGEVSVESFDYGSDGGIATVLSSYHMPGEVFFHGPGGEATQLTRVNDSLMASLELARVQNIHYPSADGTEIEGWVFFPPDYREGEARPTILRIHGGPAGMYGVDFNFEAQLLAAHGYLVLITNPRGSSGYGFDFTRAIRQKWGTLDLEDVLAGVDYVISQGWADPDRLGVGGWSYGGILTNYAITRTDRFQGAISGASMGIMVANYGHDHYQLWYEREWGWPWENRDLWEELSPFNDIGDVTTPTLFMGGSADWNVPILNSEQMYQALKRRGIDTRLVVYPGQPHGIRVPSYNLHRYREYLTWYDRYVKGEGNTSTNINRQASRGKESP